MPQAGVSRTPILAIHCCRSRRKEAQIGKETRRQLETPNVVSYNLCGRYGCQTTRQNSFGSDGERVLVMFSTFVLSVLVLTGVQVIKFVEL